MEYHKDLSKALCYFQYTCCPLVILLKYTVLVSIVMLMILYYIFQQDQMKLLHLPKLPKLPKLTECVKNVKDLMTNIIFSY